MQFIGGFIMGTLATVILFIANKINLDNNNKE